MTTRTWTKAWPGSVNTANTLAGVTTYNCRLCQMAAVESDRDKVAYCSNRGVVRHSSMLCSYAKARAVQSGSQLNVLRYGTTLYFVSSPSGKPNHNSPMIIHPTTHLTHLGAGREGPTMVKLVQLKNWTPSRLLASPSAAGLPSRTIPSRAPP